MRISLLERDGRDSCSNLKKKRRDFCGKEINLNNGEHFSLFQEKEKVKSLQDWIIFSKIIQLKLLTKVKL